MGSFWIAEYRFGTQIQTRLEYLIFEDVTICDILIISSLVKANTKSPGKRFVFLLTACFNKETKLKDNSGW